VGVDWHVAPFPPRLSPDSGQILRSPDSGQILRSPDSGQILRSLRAKRVHAQVVLNVCIDRASGLVIAVVLRKPVKLLS
jgi:hypothetical protein